MSHLDRGEHPYKALGTRQLRPLAVVQRSQQLLNELRVMHRRRPQRAAYVVLLAAVLAVGADGGAEGGDDLLGGATCHRARHGHRRDCVAADALPEPRARGEQSEGEQRPWIWETPCDDM